MAVLIEQLKVALLRRGHLSKEQREVRVTEQRCPSMVDLRILPRLSCTPSDWFSASHGGGGEVHSPPYSLLWSLCGRPATGNSWTREPNPNSASDAGTLPPDAPPLGAVLSADRRLRCGAGADSRRGLVPCMPPSRGTSAHADTPMSTQPASSLLVPVPSILWENSHRCSSSILGNWQKSKPNTCLKLFTSYLSKKIFSERQDYN